MDKTATTRPTILIVEDSRTQALQLRQFLSENGFEVVCAEDAHQAQRWLEQQIPAMIITDVLMPDMDGFAFCRAIKNNSETCQLPVLLLTRLSEPEDIVRGLESGADHFVTKPFDNTMLLAQVNNVLLNKQLRCHSVGRDGVEVTFGGASYVINAERSQIINLLLSTYDGALQQKRELEETHTKLNKAFETIKKRNAEIVELAVRDPLTKVFNRGYFNDSFPGVIRRAQRYGHNVALIMCDIDHFKLINDHYGHLAGDQVLMQLVSNFDRCLRRGVDWVARYGGEEFVIVLPETDGVGAWVVAERIRQQVAEMVVECDSQPIRLTASFGVVASSVEQIGGVTMDSMLAEADRCLYQAKEQGRNRCCITEMLVE